MLLVFIKSAVFSFYFAAQIELYFFLCFFFRLEGLGSGEDAQAMFLFRY
jgi:hypothetical protein